MPSLTSVLLNLRSEHQRDLTSSANERHYMAEIIDLFDYSIRRANRLVGKMEVDPENMERNLKLTKGMPLSEPAYILLARHGSVVDPHEHLRKLTLKAQKQGRPFEEILSEDPVMKEIMEEHGELTLENYIGDASKLVDEIVGN